MKKITNRLFALFFSVMIFLWIIWNPIWDEIINHISDIAASIPGYPYILWINPFNGPLFVVVIGLLYEVFHPTLNFKFDRSKKWIVAGAFLLAIAFIVVAMESFWKPYEPGYSILGSTTFEFPTLSGRIYTWPNWLWEFLSIFCMETVSFSLLFGSLFMTKSTPQTSKSYKIMLWGAISFELFVFIFLLLPVFVAGKGLSIYAGLTGAELLTKYWFHWDFWSELVILIGAIQLLRKGKKRTAISIATGHLAV